MRTLPFIFPLAASGFHGAAVLVFVLIWVAGAIRNALKPKAAPPPPLPDSESPSNRGLAAPPLPPRPAAAPMRGPPPMPLSTRRMVDLPPDHVPPVFKSASTPAFVTRQPMAALTPPLPQRPPMARVALAGRPPLPPPLPRKRQAALRAPDLRPPPPAPEVLLDLGTEALEVASEAMTVSRPASRTAPSSGLNAAAIASWLKPATLRSQYIISEVFDPPPALREFDEGP